jgi:hypothetical protein
MIILNDNLLVSCKPNFLVLLMSFRKNDLMVLKVKLALSVRFEDLHFW